MREAITLLWIKSTAAHPTVHAPLRTAGSQ
jgi:hypothetical protein